MEKFAEVVKLICSTRQTNFDNTPTCVLLLKEYLRREAIWAKEFGLEDELPFVNLATYNNTISLEDKYEQKLAAFTYSVVEYRCCLSMMNWYANQETVANKVAISASDPYLPLLHFFWLGGTFSREHRVFIDINNSEMIHSVTVQNADLTTAYIDCDKLGSN